MVEGKKCTGESGWTLLWRRKGGGGGKGKANKRLHCSQGGSKVEAVVEKIWWRK